MSDVASLLGYTIITVITITVIIFFKIRATSRKHALNSERLPSVCVIVLGDFGRSPRMQYHVLSLLTQMADPKILVDVVAYPGSTPIHELRDHPRMTMHSMNQPPALPKSAPRIAFLAYAPFKVLFQVIQMVWILVFSIRRPQQILVQNPPSIPTLPVAVFVCWLHQSELVVDWHNYGYTILGLTLGDTHWLVKLAKRIEEIFGALGAKHFCVTHAMKKDLKENWDIDAVALHDRPPTMFKPTPYVEQHELFSRIHETTIGVDNSKLEVDQTVFTTADGKLKSTRPALLVSSTSWTADEDFSILLAALKDYDDTAVIGKHPDVVCIITGKGPQREMYEQQIKEMKWKRVRISTVWLLIEDYPKLLGAADIGISLHASSSGLDLPMKVVDMFGCGLPVCAKRFQCIGELVKHRETGLHFDTPHDLSSAIKNLLEGFPNNCAELTKYRKNLIEFRENGWAENWETSAKPAFTN